MSQEILILVAQETHPLRNTGLVTAKNGFIHKLYLYIWVTDKLYSYCRPHHTPVQHNQLFSKASLNINFESQKDRENYDGWHTQRRSIITHHCIPNSAGNTGIYNVLGSLYPSCKDILIVITTSRSILYKICRGVHICVIQIVLPGR